MLSATLLLLSAVQNSSWEWTPEERVQLDALEKSVVRMDGSFFLDEGKWTVVTPVSPRFTAEISFFMDRFTDAFTNLIPGTPVVREKPTVVLCATKDEYRKFGAPGSRGQFVYRWDERGRWTAFHLYTYFEREEERDFSRFYRPILLHEGAHAMLRRIAGRTELPPWFDEGVGTFFQSWDPRGDAAANLRERTSRSPYLSHLKQHCGSDPSTHLRLTPLLAVKASAWNPDGMGPQATHHYAAAESFMDHLLSSEEGRAEFRRIFERIRGRLTLPLLTDREIETLETEWHTRVHHLLR